MNGQHCQVQDSSLSLPQSGSPLPTTASRCHSRAPGWGVPWELGSILHILKYLPGTLSSAGEECVSAPQLMLKDVRMTPGECGVSRKERQTERPASASGPSAENRKTDLSVLWAPGHQEPSQASSECVWAVCSVLSDSAIPQTVAHQAPLSMEFCRQEYRSGLPFPSPPHLRVVTKLNRGKHSFALCLPL